MSSPHTVATVLAPKVAMFELSVACEVFGLDRSELVDPWYRHLVCAGGPPPLRSPEGIEVHAPHGLDAVTGADTVVVPGWPYATHPPGDELLDALRAAHERGARMLSVCTGAFVLAEAGLLDGKVATTHWMHAAELARRYPRVKVDPKVLYVDAGDVLTSAGTSAGIDLCLHVVRQDHGAEVANAVARRMVVPPHRDGGQAQFVDLPVAAAAGDDPLAAVLEWAMENLDLPLSVNELARRATMSPRTFARRFRAATGTTPHRWILRQRLLLARRLLETTEEPVGRVAARCGFATAAGLRLHFSREMGASPLAYRHAFQGGNGTARAALTGATSGPGR
ncbi:MAG TPA: helix-turn-helix domain-containing protein [Acidimicrobiales bacterium]|nr:helix-turn-helix domain-containing protein [Acidimicrobiales bacterium]